MPEPTMHIHALAGCRPTPLAHYLKALGVLRLVAEQADNKARGWWQDDVFYLATQLDRDELDTFFLERYSPTPMTDPWNGGSGYYPKDNKMGIDAITMSQASRFEAYRVAIQQTRSVVAMLGAKPDKGETKNAVIAQCRRAWRGPALAWLDAALALGGDGEPAFPAMLGTGGNDGRLDFTTNFMQRLVSLFDFAHRDGQPRADTDAKLQLAIWEAPHPILEGGAIGQFLPGAAGGPNGTNGFSGSKGSNAWDFVLMLEGAVLFSSGLARRCQSTPLPQAAAPFAVRSSGAGYGSSDTTDAGPRGEQWMPLWSHPSTLGELKSLLREGRSQINGKPAGRGTDMARAIAKMGVARGITEFERYGYIERNGLSNLAVPLGRFKVKQRPHQRMLDEVAQWLDRLRQVASDKLAPQSFSRAHRACELAVLNCTRQASGRDFLNLLIALGEAEDQMLASPKFSADKCSPLPALSSRWLDVVAEDSAEYRLAVAMATQHGPLDTRSRWTSMRSHWVPLDALGKRFEKGESGLSIGPEQAALGLDLERAALAILHRRLLAANRGALDNQLPLRLKRQSLGANLDDIAAFIQRRTDDARILAIARGVMSVDLADVKYFESEPIDRSPLGGLALYGAMRLALPIDGLTLPNQAKVSVRCNAMAFQRLRNGDVGGAFQLARRALFNAGLRPKFSVAVASPGLGRRLAASMIFGLKPNQWTRLALAISDPQVPDQADQEVSDAV